MKPSKLKFKIKIWLYKVIIPYFSKLEKDVLQAYEYYKAEELSKCFHARMTPERYKALRTRPEQDRCHHLKGGRIKIGYPDDYAISVHRYSDEHTEVKCLICGKLFDTKDPQTLEMIKNSTNTATASEVVLRHKRTEA